MLDVQAADVAPHLEEDVLGDVLGRVRAAHEALDDREDALEVMIGSPACNLFFKSAGASLVLKHTMEGTIGRSG